jgi:putative DNA primase/helicase
MVDLTKILSSNEPHWMDQMISGWEQAKADGPAVRRRTRQKDEGEFSEYVLPRPELRPCGLAGILGEMVSAACANSEAVPTTVAIHILARFAVTMGRTAYINIGDEQRHLRMNALIVGPTSKGRKGTSAAMPRKLFRKVEDRLGGERVRQLTALATGEGLIFQVRDPYYDHEGELKDPGVSDKRLFCDVSEFAGVLAQARREAATLSTVLRDAFDGVMLTIPTKTSFNQATDSHIVVIGSVPETEIVKTLTSADITNGLANRFPMFYSVRTQSVPFPKPTDEGLMDSFAGHIAAALQQAVTVGEVRMTADAQEYWAFLYGEIEEKVFPPRVASLLARQSTYALIFAALLALLGRQREIGPEHLDAAMAWVDYWEQTALFVFSSSEQTEQTVKMRGLMDEIVQVVATMGGRGVPHSEVASKLTNKYMKAWPTAKAVKDAVELLQRESPPRLVSEAITTGGRPSNLYSLFKLED